MAQEIDKKHGKGTAENMHQRSQESRKYTNEELIQLTKYYKRLTDDMQGKHS